MTAKKNPTIGSTRLAAASRRRHAKPINRPAALNDLLLSRLRDDIVSGAFEPGKRLSEEQISRHYGVSRAPVRSTLIKLQAEGLIHILPQRGAFIFDPAPHEVRALCELRTALELEAAHLALQRDRAGLAERLGVLIDRMQPYAETVTNPKYQQFDSDFHLAILEAAGSELLLEAYRQTVHWRFAALRFRVARETEHASRSFQEHRDIRALVENNDAAGLGKALRVHIENTNHYYARLMRPASE